MGKKDFFRGKIPEIINQIEDKIFKRIQSTNKQTDVKGPIPEKPSQPNSQIESMSTEEIKEFLGKKQLPQKGFNPDKVTKQLEATRRAIKQEENEERFQHHLDDPRYKGLTDLPWREKMNKKIAGDGTRARQPYDKGHKDPIDPGKIRESTKTNPASHTTKYKDDPTEKLNNNQLDENLTTKQLPKEENTRAA